MYCKNCGKEINSEKDICTGCGFQGDYGNKFCANCGKEVLPGQVMCVNCGFMLNADTQEKETADNKPKEKVYMKYAADVKKINILALIMQISTICLILCMIFVPIYKYKFEPDLNDIENFEQFSQALEYGYIEENFSLFDDIKILVTQLTSNGNLDLNGLDVMMNFLIGLFAIFEVIFGGVLLIMTISSMIKTISALQNSENSTMLTYSEMAKSGKENKKENAFKKQTVLSIVLYAIFDIIYAKIYGQLFRDVLPDTVSRNMVNFSGVSTVISIVIVLLVCYIVASILKKKESEKMLLDITKEEYNK